MILKILTAGVLAFCFISCTSIQEGEFFVESELLTLPHYTTFFYYPESTSREQRLTASGKYIPSEVMQFLNSGEDYSRLLNPTEINAEMPKTIPSILDVIAASAADLKRGDFQKAIEKNRNVLNILERNRTKTLDEDFATSPFREAMLMLALAYLQAEDEEQGLPILEKLVIASNTWTPVYIALSEFYYSKKAYQLALQVATRGIDKCSNDLLPLYLAQGKAQRALGNRVAARQTINRAELLFPKSSAVLLWKGILAQDEKDYLSACEAFKLAFTQERSNPYISHNHAYCLIQSNQLEEASDILSITITNYPSLSILYYLKGFLENKRKNYLAAYKSWETYLTLIDENNPNYRLVHFKLSQMEQENILDSLPAVEPLSSTSH